MRDRQQTRGQEGFTLIELMITIVIIGILVGIALPTYQDSIRKSHRTAAQGVMMDVANRQQQFLMANRAYAASLTELNFTIPADIATRYTCSTDNNSNATPPVFNVTCIPTGSQSSSKFTTLTLTGTGVKSPTGEW